MNSIDPEPLKGYLTKLTLTLTTFARETDDVFKVMVSKVVKSQGHAHGNL